MGLPYYAVPCLPLLRWLAEFARRAVGPQIDSEAPTSSAAIPFLQEVLSWWETRSLVDSAQNVQKEPLLAQIAMYNFISSF